MASAEFLTIRRWILTGSIAAVTATGAWYGAGLKIREEVKQERKQKLEATPSEQIGQLEILRTKLNREKNDLQKKLNELARKAKQKEKAVGG